MSTTQPPLAPLTNEHLPATVVVFAALAATTWTAAYATVTGHWALLAASTVALAGSLTGLGYLDIMAQLSKYD